MKPFPDYSLIVIQELLSAWLSSQQVEVAMLRLDRLHPEISGNKWFKLKYNLEAARQSAKYTILTFGGAWSNHIAATAAACHLFGIKSIGVIRGEEWQQRASLTPTLTSAKEQGMQLQFISREQYRHKKIALQELTKKYGDLYFLPEGGNNLSGVKGCKEILGVRDTGSFTHICCPVGTGATLSGLISSGTAHQHVLGFTAIKNGDDLRDEINEHLKDEKIICSWDLKTTYHFGGFARKTPLLLQFMDDFSKQYQIPLDYVYTAKMMFGLFDLIKKKYFLPGSRILAVHTGGLQGNKSLHLP